MQELQMQLPWQYDLVHPFLFMTQFSNKLVLMKVLSKKIKKMKKVKTGLRILLRNKAKQKAVPDNLNKLSLSKLKSLLNKLVNLEDYEKAVKIRDEISKRESKK